MLKASDCVFCEGKKTELEMKKIKNIYKDMYICLYVCIYYILYYITTAYIYICTKLLYNDGAAVCTYVCMCAEVCCGMKARYPPPRHNLPLLQQQQQTTTTTTITNRAVAAVHSKLLRSQRLLVTMLLLLLLLLLMPMPCCQSAVHTHTRAHT